MLTSSNDVEFFTARLKYFQQFQGDKNTLFEMLKKEEVSKNNCKVGKFLHDIEINLLNYETNLDLDSNKVLQAYQLDYLQAVKPAGEGNSLFDAVSLCLYGNGKFAAMIQYLTGIWFAKTRALKHLYPKYDTHLDDFHVLKSIIIPGHEASALTLIAVSNTLNISITSVYPPHNGRLDPLFSTLNTTFYPIFHDPKYEKIKKIHIMWGGSSSRSQRQKWTADHFVSVFDTSVEPPVKTEPVDDSLPECDEIYEPRFKKPRYSEPQYCPPMDQDEGALADKPANVMPVSENDAAMPAKNFVPRFKAPVPKNGTELVIPKTERSDDDFLPPMVSGQPISSICGVIAIYKHLKSCTSIHNTIPQVTDNGCEFVLRLKNRHLDVNDGQDWNMEKGVFYHYHFLKNTLERIYHVGDVFCCQETVDAKSFVPMNPQPDVMDYIETMIMVVYHNSSPWFYRKVTIIEDKSSFGVLALFQYSPKTPV